MDDDWLRTDFRPVDKRDPIGKVAGWLRGEAKERPIVMDGKRPFGIVDPRRVVGTRVITTTRVDKATLPTPVLSGENSAERVAELFDKSLAAYLPVAGDESRPVAGFVDPAKVLFHWEDGPSAKQAATHVPCLHGKDTVAEAIRHFSQHDLPHLPVADEKQRIIGVLPRAVILRIEDFREQGKGHNDIGGDTVQPYDSTVQGEMEGGWSELGLDAGFDEIRERLQERTCAFVLDGNRHVQGVITAPLLIRALRELDSPLPPARMHVPAYRG